MSFFRYKNREEFARDARLVFKNCNTFNEDFSEVICYFLKLLAFFFFLMVLLFISIAYLPKIKKNPVTKGRLKFFYL